MGTTTYYPINDGDFWEYIVEDTTTVFRVFYEGLYFSVAREVINNTFIAIYADYAKPLIEYNNFLDCAYGVRIHNDNYISGTEAKILNNTFYINTEVYTSYAVYLYYSSPEIRNNEIQNYQFGVLCASYPSSYFGNAKPVIAFTSGQIFVVYRKNATEGLKERTKWNTSGNWSNTCLSKAGSKTDSNERFSSDEMYRENLLRQPL